MHCFIASFLRMIEWIANFALMKGLIGKLKELISRYACVIVPAGVWTLRLAVGCVFILSGLAKAIDPWGTIYKLTDYANMLGLQSLNAFVIFGAFALPVVEFLIGVFLVLGLYRRFAPIALLLTMLIMTPLTFYLAVTDKMADCGCFGDVIVLSNWATFLKNVALLLGAIILVRYNRKAKNLYGMGVQWMVWALSMAFVFVVEYYGYAYQPLVDFRPFKVGTSLYQGTLNGDDDDMDDKFLFIYTKDGVEREFTLDSLPDDTWEYVDRRSNVAEEEPVEQSITIFDGGFDRTSELLNNNGEQLIFAFPDLENISISVSYLINELNEFAQDRGVNTFGVTSANANQVANWKDISMAQYAMYEMDDTDMKMLVRGNPGVVYLKDGVIKWKRALASISNEDLQSESADMMSIVDDYDAVRTLRWLIGAYLTLLILILLVNRMHVLVKFTIKSIVKNDKKDVTLQ